MTRSHVGSRALAALALVSLISACSGGGGGGNPPPAPTPTPTPTPTPGPVGAYTCTSSDTVSDVARSSGASVGLSSLFGETRFAPRRRAAASANTGLVAVVYAGGLANRTSAEAAERANAANFVSDMSFSHTGRYLRVLSVRPGTEAMVAAALRTQPGVVEAGMTGQRRYTQAVNTQFWPNDPYFNGFTMTQNIQAGNTQAAATFHVPPYEESGGNPNAVPTRGPVPGQWEMHAIRLEYAFEYSQASNGSGVAADSGALGVPAVKIALIDSGQDTSHPELNAKNAYQKCFITNPQNVQSTSNFTVDQDGHGTDTAGLAGAIMNNGTGFVGAGGNSGLMLYRVFPKPDDTCAAGTTNQSAVCGADTRDIASAINDAVAQGANVISLSLGGGTCPDDPVEGNAVANAIGAHVIVVASAGNGAPATQGLSTPACDPSVIAAGATSLADGQPNGAGNSNGSAGSPIEYVASYSQYGTNNTVRSSSAWGIVAPGGDPTGGNDNDDLHWIENIWTSTPFKSSPADMSFVGNCGNDYPNGTLATSPDCRTLIAGTSMSAPIVAGAAALILSATGGRSSPYQSPSTMKALLCGNAHDIGDPHQGCGRLDVYRAMAVVVSDPNPPQ